MGVGCCVGEIAVLEQGHANTDRIALDGRHDRQVAVDEAANEGHAGAVACGTRSLEILEIVSRGKVPARPCQDNSPGLLVDAGLTDRPGKPEVGRDVQRVSPLRTVDGQNQNAIFDLAQNGIGQVGSPQKKASSGELAW